MAIRSRLIAARLPDPDLAQIPTAGHPDGDGYYYATIESSRGIGRMDLAKAGAVVLGPVHRGKWLIASKRPRRRR